MKYLDRKDKYKQDFVPSCELCTKVPSAFSTCPYTISRDACCYEVPHRMFLVQCLPEHSALDRLDGRARQMATCMPCLWMEQSVCVDPSNNH